MGSRTSLYVYNGRGVVEACRNQLFKTLSALVHPDHHSVQYIYPEDIRCGQWKKDAALIAFGGGYDTGYLESLTSEGMEQVRSYVESGGSYLGLCAGGYFACDRIEFDKQGPLCICDERYLKFFPGVCCGPVFPGFDYRSFKGSTAASVTYRPTLGEPYSFSSFYNGGGKFSLDKKDVGEKVEVLAKYNDLHESSAAIVKSIVGNDGVAILTGIHPEYDSSGLPKDDIYVQGFVDELKKWDKERISCFIDVLKHLRITLNCDGV